MENLSSEARMGIYSLAFNLHQSRPTTPANAVLRRRAMEWAIQTLRNQGYDAKWFCVELVERFIDLRQKSDAIISDYRLQKVLKEMQLSEVNFSLLQDTHTDLDIFSKAVEKIYKPREAADTTDPNDYVIRSRFSSTTFFYEAKTPLLWCSVDKNDLAKVIDLLYHVGLHHCAWNVLKFLRFDPLTGKHWTDDKPKKKIKRRRVIVEENDHGLSFGDDVPSRYPGSVSRESRRFTKPDRKLGQE